MTLFDTDPTAGVPDPERVALALTTAYAAELLDRPPVRCVGPDDPSREANALRLAKKDVQRLLRAAGKIGFTFQEIA